MESPSLRTASASKVLNDMSQVKGYRVTDHRVGCFMSIDTLTDSLRVDYSTVRLDDGIRPERILYRVDFSGKSLHFESIEMVELLTTQIIMQHIYDDYYEFLSALTIDDDVTIDIVYAIDCGVSREDKYPSEVRRFVRETMGMVRVHAAMI